MTRGRPPKKACKEACGSAAQRGRILEAAGIAGSRTDFILFVRQRVVFVHVKRSHSRISTPKELNVVFNSGIAGLRTVPLTAVVSRQLWVLLPWGTWQYFLIGDDSIVEIHDYCEQGTGTDESPATVPHQPDPVSALPGRWDAFTPRS
jgi:hypothetical protein